MSVTSGFFNSLQGDRKYNAEEFTSLFDGIILDGVFRHTDNELEVRAYQQMVVRVDTGRAWFNQTWTKNDQVIDIVIDDSDSIMNRIDAIVVEVNKGDNVRANSIKVIKGTSAYNPSRPTLTKDNINKIYQYALAYIYVGAGVISITQNDITDMRGSDETPWVGVVEDLSDIQKYVYISNGEIHVGAESIVPVTGSDMRNYAYISSGTVHIGANSVTPVTDSAMKQYAYIDNNGTIHMGSKTLTPLSAAAMQQYAYISNGTVTIGSNSVTPVTQAGLQNFASISGNTVTINGTSLNALGINKTSKVLDQKAIANASAVTTLSDKQMRNIHAGTEEMTSGSSALTTGDIYFQYET